MALIRQKTDLPVVGEVYHFHARRRDIQSYTTPLKYAPPHNTGKIYSGESMAKRARRMLATLRKLGAA